jgi:hypothetical protein
MHYGVPDERRIGCSFRDDFRHCWLGVAYFLCTDAEMAHIVMVRGQGCRCINVVVTGIIHESVMGRRKLRIAVRFAKIFQILAVVFGTEIDWHTQQGSFDVKVDMHSSSNRIHYQVVPA